MPTYEYACKACGHRFDTWQSMTDDALTICPVCGGELRKVFAPPAITFKGSGFYATDHGKKAKTGEAGGGKKEPATASSKADGAKSSEGGSSSGSRSKEGSSTGSGSGPKDGSSGSGSKDGSSGSGSTTSPSKGSSS